jgi:hypothetical protein
LDFGGATSIEGERSCCSPHLVLSRPFDVTARKLKRFSGSQPELRAGGTPATMRVGAERTAKDQDCGEGTIAVTELDTPSDLPSDWPKALGFSDPMAPVTTAELRAYTHEAPGEPDTQTSPRGYYLRSWQPILRGRSSMAGFNWAAALFGPLWCFYRKLFRVGVGLIVAELLMSFLFGMAAILASGTADSTNQALAGVLSFLAVRVPFGWAANPWYAFTAFKVVQNARAHCVDPHARQALLLEKGGTSHLALALALGLSCALALWHASGGAAS